MKRRYNRGKQNTKFNKTKQHTNKAYINTHNSNFAQHIMCVSVKKSVGILLFCINLQGFFNLIFVSPISKHLPQLFRVLFWSFCAKLQRFDKYGGNLKQISMQCILAETFDEALYSLVQCTCIWYIANHGLSIRVE